MGQILHRCAKTTNIIRDEIRHSDKSIYFLAKKYNISWATAKKWSERDSGYDKQMGNGRANSVLTEDEEIVICTARRKTWLALDDLLDHLQPAIPKLTRSNLHRCLKHHGISRVPEEISPKKKSGKFRDYEIGYVHIDITEFYLNKRKWYIFVAIDRISKMCFAELFDKKTLDNSLVFLQNAIRFYPYKLHRILTDNGTQFTYRGMPKERRPKEKRHPFSEICRVNGIKHKLTKFYSPQTNGQVEKMNDIIKSSTLKYFHYDSIEQFSLSLAKFLNYYNLQKPLKSLKRKSPYEFVLQKWAESPKLFNKNPHHHCMGLDI